MQKRKKQNCKSEEERQAMYEIKELKKKQKELKQELRQMKRANRK